MKQDRVVENMNMNNADHGKEYYTITEIAIIKGCSRQAVHGLIKRREVLGKQLGYFRVFSKMEMEQLVKKVAVLIILLLGGINTMVDANVQGADERDIVIKTLMGEGLGEGLTGMTAIAETIRNRAAMRKISPAQVAMQPYQYSFWNDPEHAKAFMAKHGTGEAYQLASQAYEKAFSERSELTNGATHYYNPKAVTHVPDWAKQYEHKGRVGQHEFYYGR